MTKLHIITLLFRLMFSPFGCVLAVEPVTIHKAFMPSEELFANPERGWIVHRESDNMHYLNELRNSPERVSLVLIKINISAYRNKRNIAAKKLTEIRKALDKCREQGLKAILRSAYAWDDKKLLPDPINIQTIKTHVMDMKSIYYEYEDTIMAVEMGMFGPWGEMHSSNHNTINNKGGNSIEPKAIENVHDIYMSALPKTRSVLLRRPHYIRQIFKTNKTVTYKEVCENTPQARTGYHNDAYLNSKDDAGTFLHGWDREDELVYINQLTRYAILGGESYGDPNGTYNNAINALKESKQQHMTYLHRDFEKKVYDGWGSVVKEEFTRKLGYRFQLLNIKYFQQVKPGSILNLTLKLRNIGFAAMQLKRPVNLILDNGNTGNKRIQYPPNTLPVDPRTWLPESGIITIHYKFPIPVNINKGTWQLLLSLPDASKRLERDPRYAVQFANRGVWSPQEGTNMLVNNIKITDSTPNFRSNDEEIKILHTTTPPSMARHTAVKTASTLILSTVYDKPYTLYQAFIDTDNNPATGYLVEGIGADILVENSRYHQYNGKNRDDWSWTAFAGRIPPSIKDNRYTWQLPLTTLGKSISSASQVVFAGTTNNVSTCSSAVMVFVDGEGRSTE